MNAYDAAVEAMATAIMRPDVRDFYDERPDPGAAAYYRERATDALAALVRSEAVLAALVAAVDDWCAAPHAHCGLDAVLDALTEGGAGT